LGEGEEKRLGSRFLDRGLTVHGEPKMSRHDPILLPCSLLFSMALAVGGCDDEGVGDPGLAGLSEETVEIVENLQRAGYPREEIEIDEDEVVVVGGDAVVTLEA